jgi:hypothetical protein
MAVYPPVETERPVPPKPVRVVGAERPRDGVEVEVGARPVRVGVVELSRR